MRKINATPGYQLVALERQLLDLSQPAKIPQQLSEIPFDCLINTAALSSPDECENNPQLAARCNAQSPAEMAKFCHQNQRKFLHYSTDYVFSGQQSGYLDESVVPEPINVYGQSKLDGERAILAANPAAIIARVSWLFGPGKTSFFDFVLDSAQQGKPLAAIANKFSLPTYTVDLVDWSLTLLENKAAGIYHLCNSGDAQSWHSYASEIIKQAKQLDLLPEEVGVRKQMLDEMVSFTATRPIHTVMRTQRIEDEFNIKPRPWNLAARDFLHVFRR